MNKVIILGRLTANPELRETTSEISVTSFNIAIDRGYGEKKTTDFIPVVAYRKTAELVVEYLKKGSRVVIEGNLKTRTYEDKNNQKRFVMEVIAETVQFLEGKQETPKEKPTKNEIDQAYEEFGNIVELDSSFEGDFGF